MCKYILSRYDLFHYTSYISRYLLRVFPPPLFQHSTNADRVNILQAILPLVTTSVAITPACG